MRIIFSLVGGSVGRLLFDLFKRITDDRNYRRLQRERANGAVAQLADGKPLWMSKETQDLRTARDAAASSPPIW